MNVTFFIPSALSSRKYEMANAKTMAIARLMAPFLMISAIMGFGSVAFGWNGSEPAAGIALHIPGGFAANARCYD
jgi:hypothetical protein